MIAKKPDDPCIAFGERVPAPLTESSGMSRVVKPSIYAPPRATSVPNLLQLEGTSGHNRQDF
jgi:hypothetical protein